MVFGSFNPHRPQAMMADINVTPMVDVMLVLLVVFIITAPMLTHAVRLELPRVQASGGAQQAEAINVSIDKAGQVFWNNEPLGPDALAQRLVRTAAMTPQPELQLRADKDTRYEVVARVMAAAQSHGVSRIGFVTKPAKEATNGAR